MYKPMEYVLKNGKAMRTGYTTGSCAAAAAAAAAEMLLLGKNIYEVRLKTPKGTVLYLEIEKIDLTDDYAVCAVKKYSGDDPDITNGIYVYAKVTKILTGIVVSGGQGVGKVTRAGLSVSVGKPAINPVPMAMILEEVGKIVQKYDCTHGMEIEISIPDGEKLAQKTYNPKLGIEGGLSVLGTTGIVEPMSNKALVDTIKLEIDMLKASGARSVLVVPGNYGRSFARERFGMEFDSAVQCSNFIGEALDYISYVGFENVLIMGHGGKLVKVAGGVMNTHSSIADCRMEILASHMAMIREISPDVVRAVMDSITVDAANDILDEMGLLQNVWNSVGERVVYHIRNRLGSNTTLFAVIFGRDGILYSYGDHNEIAEVFGDGR